MKTRIQFLLLIVILSIFTGIPVSGQTTRSKVSLNESVYLRTDHVQYIAGSLIFFKAYIFSDLSVSNPASGDTLYVALIDQDGLNVVSETFQVKDYEA